MLFKVIDNDNNALIDVGDDGNSNFNVDDDDKNVTITTKNKMIH